jgi:NADPH-dependent F420 reductase
VPTVVQSVDAWWLEVALKIAILGGTGDEGLGLAMRFAKAGDEIIIGSRSEGRAQEAAHKVREVVPFAHVAGMANDAAADAAETVIVSVPYNGQKDTLTALAPVLAGKLVVSVVVPLQFGRGGPHALRVAEGSAAEEARAAVPDARIVSAFHNLSATKLMDVEADLDCDVVVCGDDAEAKRTVMELAEKMQGVRALDGGGLSYSRYVEDLTALILALNRRYKAHASIKLTGIER